MTLLAPLGLALALAAIVPILLHLLRRRSATTVAFPAVRFLEEAQRDRRQQTTLRQRVLLALRVLAILALALAAARPLGRPGGTGHAPTALAIVLDNSLRSTAAPGGMPVLEALVAEARTLIAATSPPDAVWLVLADGTVHVGAAAIDAALGQLVPFPGGGDLPQALGRAAALVTGSDRRARHIVVLSEGSASAFPRPADVEGVAVTLVVPPRPPAPNAALTALRSTPDRWAPWGTLEIAARTATPVDVRVVIGERTVARGTVTPDAPLTVRAQAPSAGWLAGRVELPPDELRGDDVRHFAVIGAAPPALRVDASAGPFAQQAVASLIAAGRVRSGDAVQVVAAPQLTGGAPALVVAPRSATELVAANRALAAARIPWRLGPPRPDSARVREGPLDGVRVRRAFTLTVDGDTTDTRILASVSGQPWIVAGIGYVLIGSALDGEATDLPLRAAFVPWLSEMTQTYLTRDGGPILGAAPGQTVALPLSIDEIIAPDGSTRPVTAATLMAPSVVGVHWLRQQGRVVAALVVDPEPEATDPAPLASAAAIATRSDGAVLRVARGDEALPRAFAVPAPQPIASALLLLLIAVLVLEGWLARPARPVNP